jgi:UDP-N-acetylmuramoylalanine--D-glutamate ligase
MFTKDKLYGILGLARSGEAAAYKILELGGKAFLSDYSSQDKVTNADKLQADFDCEFGGHTDKLLKCDEWIVSPGIPLDAPIIKAGLAAGIPMISEIEFGYQIKATDSKIIAVTGSNGKSTTASLIYHILTGLGKKAILAGNIGDAFCVYPIEKPGIEYIVLEISSFQLDLRPNVAVLLNITPDHLNRYLSFEHYAMSKLSIFEHMLAEDTAILNFDDVQTRSRDKIIKAPITYFTGGDKVSGVSAWNDGVFLNFEDTSQLSIYDIGIRGPHNSMNAMASVLAVNAVINDLPRVIAATKGFKALQHRLEYVATVNGVAFYNDSKATNTDSVKFALLSFDKPIRVMMGGSDKGEDFGCITDLLSRHASKVYITGDTVDKMRQSWLGKVPLTCIDDFDKCLRSAFEESMAGDVIVLSPGCASFDRFKNFEHRGRHFKELVQTIKREHEKD